MSPETWVKILYTYGPYALLVFFVFVAELKARNVMRTKKGTMSMAIYGGVWVVIFLLVGYSLYAWDRVNLRNEPTIRGTLGKLEGSETVTSESASLFLRRIYDDRKGRFHYEWRLITPKRLSANEKVRFTFDRSTAQSEQMNDYEMAIRPGFYDSEVQIFYDRQNNKLLLRVGDQEEELPPLLGVASTTSYPVGGFLVGAAFALERLSAAEVSKALESSDPIIRRDARAEIARQGVAALPWIQEVLADRERSYRVRLGALSALNQMQALPQDALSPPALAAIIDASAHPDPTLRAEARRYLVDHASWELEAKVNRALSSTRGEGGSPASPSPRVAELARTELELLYNLGILEKDKYGSRRLEDRQRMGTALAAFRKAWELQALAARADRVVFTKALYGWGLALHDRSWIERRPDGSRDPASVRTAQDKFREFLGEVTRTGDPRAYPFPLHLKQAEAYLRNPIPDSLR